MENIATIIIALIALLVSGFTFFQTRSANREQKSLTEREIEFIRLQIVKERNAHSDGQKAQISARLYKSDRNNYRVRIFNIGPADAQNVRVVLTSDESLIHQGSLEEKFPMERMEKGQSVDVLAMVHLQSHAKEDITIQWEDSSSEDRTNTVSLTL